MNKLAILLIIAIALNSCSIFRKGGQNASDRMDKKVIEENYVPAGFKYFKGKMKVNMNSDAYNGTMMLFLKIRDDSLIWGSVTALLGFEVARFFITKDSLTLLDRMHQTYYKYPFSILGDKFGIYDINYQFIQDFFTGNYLFDISKNFDRQENETNLVYSMTDKGTQKTVFVNKKNFRINKYVILNDSLSRHIVIDYSDKIKNKGIAIPKQIRVEVIKPYKMDAEMTYSNINFQEFLEFNTEIPASYEKGK